MWMDNWVLNLPPDLWPQKMGLSKKIIFRFFESKKTAVVLANSNQASVECDIEFCQQKNIPILKRRGGGGTVVLGPGCLILTFAFLAKDVFNNQRYFSLINNLWIDALKNEGLKNLEQRGHSDIACDGKKIAGTSLFRKKNLVVYQGSLLVDPDLQLISKALKHPSREPDYRSGRQHEDFLTTTQKLGLSLNAEELARKCTKHFFENVEDYFLNDLL